MSRAQYQLTEGPLELEAWLKPKTKITAKGTVLSKYDKKLICFAHLSTVNSPFVLWEVLYSLSLDSLLSLKHDGISMIWVHKTDIQNTEFPSSILLIITIYQSFYKSQQSQEDQNITTSRIQAWLSTLNLLLTLKTQNSGTSQNQLLVIPHSLEPTVVLWT